MWRIALSGLETELSSRLEELPSPEPTPLLLDLEEGRPPDLGEREARTEASREDHLEEDLGEG